MPASAIILHSRLDLTTTSDVCKSFERLVYRFGHQNFGTQKTLLKFFQLYFSKKYLEVAINDFTMHLITLKWLR